MAHASMIARSRILISRSPPTNADWGRLQPFAPPPISAEQVIGRTVEEICPYVGSYGSRSTDLRPLAVAPTHSITSSARASSVGGTSRPIALTALRLITSSNLVACWTGISLGL